MGLNFDGIEAAADRIMTQPGTIGVFKIVKPEFGESKEKHTRYLKLVFEDKTSSFSHSFYLSEKALPRLQSLAEASLGAKLTGNLNDEQIIAKFTGKEVALKVTGQVSTTGKGYPNLSFGGFCKPKGEVQFLEFNSKEVEEIEAAKAAIARNPGASADQESAGTATGAPAAGAATGEQW